MSSSGRTPAITAYERIESAANERVKGWARLKERRARRASGLFLVEGRRETERALAGGVRPKQLLLAPELAPPDPEAQGLSRLAEEARARGGEVALLSPAAFRRVSLRDKPDGVALVALSLERAPADLMPGEGDLVLVLDGLEKPGNLGALMRSAEAFGVDALFLTGVGAEGGGTDLENPNVIRASMGSLFTLATAVGGREEVAEALAGAGLRLVATTPTGATPLYDADLTGGVALLLGAEHAGLAEWWLERAHARVSIPMRSGASADSLNVSVAGAVVLSEAQRQRSGAG